MSLQYKKFMNNIKNDKLLDEKATLKELKLQIIFFVDFRCYAMMGSFSESAQYLKVCLPAIQERYGPHSIEVGHELIKYTDVLLGK